MRYWPPDDKVVVVGWRTFYQFSRTGTRLSGPIQHIFGQISHRAGCSVLPCAVANIRKGNSNAPLSWFHFMEPRKGRGMSNTLDHKPHLGLAWFPIEGRRYSRHYRRYSRHFRRYFKAKTANGVLPYPPHLVLGLSNRCPCCVAGCSICKTKQGWRRENSG
jgi:hypothetical protein